MSVRLGQVTIEVTLEWNAARYLSRIGRWPSARTSHTLAFQKGQQSQIEVRADLSVWC